MAVRETITRRPHLACEISAGHVIAGRAGKGGAVELVSSRTLPEGTITPGLGGSNVQDAHAVRLAIAEALAAVRQRSREVIAVLPDSAVRVVLLDFETLPERRQEAAAVVRFRLKKSLPFNVDDAVLSFDWHRVNGEYKVVAAVVPRSIREEYESAFRDVGYQAGLVLPSTLAALGSVNADRPTLVIKVDAGTVTVAIVDANELRLMRTQENPMGGDLTGEHIAADVHPSIVFFEDTYSARIERILLAGLPVGKEVTSALQEQTGLPVQPLIGARQMDLSTGSTPPSLLAGIVGALIG